MFFQQKFVKMDPFDDLLLLNDPLTNFYFFFSFSRVNFFSLHLSIFLCLCMYNHLLNTFLTTLFCPFIFFSFSLFLFLFFFLFFFFSFFLFRDLCLRRSNDFLLLIYDIMFRNSANMWKKDFEPPNLSFLFHFKSILLFLHTSHEEC